jgi:hypothetical protein
MENEYLSVEQCEHNSLYRIDGRNFSLGVYNNKKQGFVGIREKFTTEFLSLEFHYEMGAPYGTVKPIEFLEKCPMDANDGSEELFKWLKERRKYYL